jgi:hypothetical protein
MTNEQRPYVERLKTVAEVHTFESFGDYQRDGLPRMRGTKGGY